MIKSFRDGETEKVFRRRFSRRLPTDIQSVALRKLRMLSNAVNVNDLRSPPANRLEKLSGDREGQYSIRINDQWRICFSLARRRRLRGRDLRLPLKGAHMTEKRLPPVHPGEVLLEEFLKPLGLSQNRLGLSIGVHPRRINEIVLRKRRVTAETALRLARYFGTSPQFWLGLQSDYDLDVAADELGERLEREVQVRAEAG